MEVEQLLREGGGAYQLGDFDLAIEKFEAAYKLEPKAPLLYNLALSYLRRYDSSHAASDLHRARALLTNFGIALKADPSLGDADNVEKLIEQIDSNIAAHEREETEREAERREQELRIQAEATPEPECPVVEVDDPADARRSRTIGAAVMAAGSVSLAAGVASIAGFALKGAEFKNNLEVLQAERAELGCDVTVSPDCETYDEAIAATITNGRRANIFAGTIGGTLTALGTAGLVAGIVIYARSAAKSQRRARVNVAPGLSGVVVSGRF